MRKSSLILCALAIAVSLNACSPKEQIAEILHRLIGIVCDHANAKQLALHALAPSQMKSHSSGKGHRAGLPGHDSSYG